MSKSLTLDSETAVGKAAGHLAIEVDGDVMLMSASHGRYVGLDDIGSEIWRRLDKPQTLPELCGSLAEDFEAEAGVISRDVSAFLTSLHKCGLLELKQNSPGAQ